MTGHDPTTDGRTDDRPTSRTRRGVLAATGLAGAASLSGCLGLLDGGTQTGTTTGESGLAAFRGSGPLVESRPEIDAPRIDDLPDLSGSLTIYLGGGEGGLYAELLRKLKNIYPDFEPEVRPGGSAEHANTIVEEQKAGGSEADVFWSIEAGSLARVAAEGYTVKLPQKGVSNVPGNFRPNRQWVGVAGRARAVPYNTNKLSESDVPSKVKQFPNTGALSNAVGWAPAYGAFQAFVTAMRLQRGRSATKQWLQSMQDHGVSKYPDEFQISNAVADGELAAGFANHYYVLRVKSNRSNAPLDLAFTSGDAGALINSAGTAVIEGTSKESLAKAFVRHLLTAEAQEFFATRAFAYPMVSGIPPVGGLPTIDELSPPDVNLQKLSDIEPTIELLQEVGAL